MYMLGYWVFGYFFVLFLVVGLSIFLFMVLGFLFVENGSGIDFIFFVVFLIIIYGKKKFVYIYLIKVLFYVFILMFLVLWCIFKKMLVMVF